MAKASKPVRGIYVLPAIFGPLFLLFLAISGDPLEAAKVAAILFGAAMVGVPFVVVALLTPVAFHELGHLLAGRRVGFTFVSLKIGPWTWQDRKRRTDWKFDFPIGLCVMQPPSSLPTWGEAVTFVAGGPIASLAVALVGLAVHLGLSSEPGTGTAGLVRLVGTLTLVGNGGALVSSLLPARVGGLSSDGLQLLDLWRRKRAYHLDR